MKKRPSASERLADGTTAPEKADPGDPNSGKSAEQGGPPAVEYSLPFEVVGTLRVGSSGTPVVIIEDKESGREFHYQEGETHGGVHFRRVEPGVVDLVVPDGGRCLRFVWGRNRWQRL